MLETSALWVWINCRNVFQRMGKKIMMMRWLKKNIFFYQRTSHFTSQPITIHSQVFFNQFFWYPKTTTHIFIYNFFKVYKSTIYDSWRSLKLSIFFFSIKLLDEKIINFHLIPNTPLYQPLYLLNKKKKCIETGGSHFNF